MSEGQCKKPLFRDLDASEDLDELETSELESLCMNCEEMGVTRLLLTKIPLFREVILMSFSCPHCHYSDSEIQPGGPVQDQGVKFSLHLKQIEDLSRVVVKANSATVRIPHLDFEIPPKTQKGKVTTIEGIIKQAIDDIEKEQPIRKAMDPEVGLKLDTFIHNLRKCLKLVDSFTFELDDPAGNSFIENKLAPSSDPSLSIVNYKRSHEQDLELGITSPSESTQAQQKDNTIEHSEVLMFQTNCSNCQSPTETRMKTVDVPHFKEVILMSMVCEYCGFKSNEVKSGAGISATGIKLTLHLTAVNDLARDILKNGVCGFHKWSFSWPRLTDLMYNQVGTSIMKAPKAATSSLSIPELDFEVQPGTLGGQFTTVEGLLTQIKDQLSDSVPFSDSRTTDQDHHMKKFLKELDQVVCGNRMNVHLVLDDPAGNSYVQNIYAPDEDPELKVERYERTLEQNDLLGLIDMNTDNYVEQTDKS